jgi:hypothetical protein
LPVLNLAEQDYEVVSGDSNPVLTDITTPSPPAAGFAFWLVFPILSAPRHWLIGIMGVISDHGPEAPGE